MKDIKNTNEQELAKTLREKREALRNFRFGISGSKLKNVKEGRSIRREIAQILTELNERRHDDEKTQAVEVTKGATAKIGAAKLAAAK